MSSHYQQNNWRWHWNRIPRSTLIKRICIHHERSIPQINRNQCNIFANNTLFLSSPRINRAKKQNHALHKTHHKTIWLINGRDNFKSVTYESLQTTDQCIVTLIIYFLKMRKHESIASFVYRTTGRWIFKPQPQSQAINHKPTLRVTENTAKTDDNSKIHIGKRGGKYRLDANGKKVYLNKRAAWN